MNTRRHVPGNDERLPGNRLALILFQSAFWIPLLVCTYLALVPEPPDNPVFRVSDVILHGAAFTYLSLALVLALFGTTMARQSIYVRTFVCMLGYGIFLELVQSLVPERSAEFKDLFVDVVGIVIGLMLAAVLAGPVYGLTIRLSARL